MIEPFLRALLECGGSDLHCKVGSPPRVRIDGRLRTLQTRDLTAADTVQAVARSLEPGETTVGVSAHLEHLAASPVGATVDVEAVVQERTGRRITCTARMSAGERTLATANIVRVVVNRATFEAGTG